MVNIELKSAVKEVLGQLAGVLSQISAEDYQRPVPTLNGSTIGQHIRHTLEFFICLIEGHMTGVVNYDKRNHDQSIEMDNKQALTSLSSIITFIDNVRENHQFKLEIDYGIEEELASTIETNFNRELAYNIEHAIHHMAIFKIGINAICPYLELPTNFGVANSTVKYQKHKNQPRNS